MFYDEFEAIINDVRNSELSGEKLADTVMYLTEVKELIESAFRESGLRKQISKAAFCHQDIHEIDALMLPQ